MTHLLSYHKHNLASADVKLYSQLPYSVIELQSETDGKHDFNNGLNKQFYVYALHPSSFFVVEFIHTLA